MKTIEIDANSKLYRFAQKWGKLRYYHGSLDTCKFKSRIMYGVLMWTLCKLSIALLAAVFGYCLGDFGVWLYVGFTEGFVEPNIPAKIIITLLAMTLFISTLMLIEWSYGEYKTYRRRKRKELELAEPGVVRQLYLSAKDKYCAKIEVKNREIEPWD